MWGSVQTSVPQSTFYFAALRASRTTKEGPSYCYPTEARLRRPHHKKVPLVFCRNHCQLQAVHFQIFTSATRPSNSSIVSRPSNPSYFFYGKRRGQTLLFPMTFSTSREAGHAIGLGRPSDFDGTTRFLLTNPSIPLLFAPSISQPLPHLLSISESKFQPTELMHGSSPRARLDLRPRPCQHRRIGISTTLYRYLCAHLDVSPNFDRCLSIRLTSWRCSERFWSNRANHHRTNC